jgi:hypothetical protein
MNRVQIVILFFISCWLLSTCQRPLIIDDDQVDTNAKWDLANFQSERLIQGLHATPFEWFAISENEFHRFDGNDKLQEKRPLNTASGVRGIPALNDNTFFRLTIDENSKQVLEFHLTRNPAEVLKLPASSLLATGESHIEIEFLARGPLGAFSSDGTLFLLPAKVFPASRYVFFLFEIQHNTSHTAFASVKVARRVEPAGLAADFAKLNTIRFLDGSFYVTSKEGAWRISPSGDIKKLFTQWMLDFFSWKGKLYVTGLNPFDMHESTDNGITWTRLEQNSELKLVETTGEQLFSHEVPGHPFRLGAEDFLKTREIVYPAVQAAQNPSVFYGVAFFAGRYYFSIDREVYFTNKVVVK